ncbi:MAG TPA: ATP-binding protein [Gaiellaceae bacterium]|jgi:PAS domain S-box-containing protein|nr:ATP-binding protein [Gaiellaceae bacterium]
MSTPQTHDAADRARRLQRVAELLAEVVTPQEVLDAILTDGVRAAEAHAGAIGVLSADGETIELLAQRGYDPDVMSSWATFPVDAQLPMSEVVRTGKPLFISTLAERNRLYPSLSHLGQEGNALVVLPLAVQGAVFGGLSLSFDRDIEFEQERRELKMAFARQAAQALARSRLYAAEQALRERMTFLAEASELLASSLDYNRTLARLAQLCVPGLADWCAIDILGPNGEIERLAVAHQDPEKVRWAHELQERYPPDPDAPHGVANVLRTGAPEFLPSFPQELLDEALGDNDELRRIVDELGLNSSITVPLNARGRTLGALSLIAAETHPPFTQADFELALEVARRAAVAVDNARLFREAERGANAARALAYVADGVVLIDKDNIVRHWNPAAALITGVAEEDALDRPVRDVVPSWDALTTHVPLVAPGAPARPVTVPIVIDGDERWVAVSGVAFMQGRVYALQDVTEERALEKTRSDFVTTASHELRTPLAAVYGAIRTLRREDVELSEEDQAQFLEMIEAEATRLARIVDQILLAGQLDADAVELEVTECDPSEIAARVIESAQVHSPETISLSLDVDGTPKISCDENKLRQVLVNLVDNAVKYSPGGGRVELRVRNGNGSCVIDVVDEGLGIPPGERERIFEKFYRLDPDQTHGVGGSGLGLYIVRELVERMDGRLSVESELGKGSRFTLELPAR